jgi:outer membrane protein assembly factor BamD
LKKRIQLIEKNLELQVLEAYKEGIKIFRKGDVYLLQKNLMKLKFYFPIYWAPKSALMAAYAYYSQDYYGDAIAEIEDL